MFNLKKSIIGLVVIGCIAVCAYFVYHYNSDEKGTFPERNQFVDPDNISREMALITVEVMEGLKGKDVVGDIHTNYQESVTIQTFINSSDNEAAPLKSDIEETVKEILNSEELKSVSNINSYKVIVESNSKEGQEIEENAGIIGFVVDREGDKVLIVDSENKDTSIWLSGAPEEIRIGQEVKVEYGGVVFFSNPAQAEFGDYEIVSEVQ